MGYCFWIAVTATSIILNTVIRTHAHPSQQMLQQQSPLTATEPSQTQCPQLKSLTYNPNSNSGQIPNWSVVKVTRMSEMSAGPNPQDEGQLQRAFCGLFSDVSNCLGISYTVVNRGNFGFAAQMFAYDGKSQNIQPQDRSFNLVDQSFEIYSVQKSNAPNVVSGMNQGTAPEEIMFAAIAENASGAWKMFALCDQSIAWVVAPADELKRNPQYLDSYKAEIEGALQQIKSSMASMSQGTGAMNTNMSPPTTSLHNPLPIVSIFNNPSATSPPTAASPPQYGVQGGYAGETPNPQTASQNAIAYASIGSPTAPPVPSPAAPAPALFGGASPPPVTSPPTAAGPPQYSVQGGSAGETPNSHNAQNAIAYASIGSPTAPVPSPAAPAPALFGGASPPPGSQPSGVIIP